MLEDFELTTHAVATVESLAFWRGFLQGFFLKALVSSLDGAVMPQKGEAAREELAEEVVKAGKEHGRLVSRGHARLSIYSNGLPLE